MFAIISKRRVLVLNHDNQVVAFADNSIVEHRKKLYPEGELANYLVITKFKGESVSLKVDFNLFIGGRTYDYNGTLIKCDRDFAKAEIIKGGVSSDFVFSEGINYYTTLDTSQADLFLLTTYLMYHGLTSVPIYTQLAIGKRLLDRLWQSFIVHGLICGALYLALLIIVESDAPATSGDAINRVTLYLLTYFTIITYIVAYRETNKLYNRGVGLWVSNICIFLMFISFIITCIAYMVDCNQDRYCFIRDDYNFGTIPISSCVL